jgi:RsiW-degrading membrane proteinase PrsW (M82 family)
MEDVLKPFEEDPRIEREFTSDRNWSLFGVAVLWALYAFVFYEIRDYAGSGEVMLALAISGGLVLLFNTASIFALISQLNLRRKEIYGLDLHYLDLQKKKR